MELLLHIAAGAAIGACIGLTGVGGGSLMTPLLLILGYPLPTAVGTDLLYAALTKSFGMYSHSRQRTVNWRIAIILMAGSVPATILTIVFFGSQLRHTDDYTQIVTQVLGGMLVATAIVILLHQKIKKRMALTSHSSESFNQRIGLATLGLGVILGISVTLSSVGAGAIAAAMLMLFYPYIPMVKIVGTDIAHAVPLTFLAGLGYLWLGYVDWQLLLGLLIGSIPTVALGSRLAKRAPEMILRPILAIMLLLLGVNFLLAGFTR